MSSLLRPPPRQAGFADRRDAGRRLASRLGGLRGLDPVVVALPRGGVPVAEQIAAGLGAPLEVLVVRKLGAPGHPEYGIGAVAEGGVRIIDPEIAQLLGTRNGEMERIVAAEEAELRRRVRAYRGEEPLPDLSGRTVIVVDDGVATGATDLAAVRALRRLQPKQVIVAVPVCAAEAHELLSEEADAVVALTVPKRMGSVSRFYERFDQVSDEEVSDALDRARHAPR